MTVKELREALAGMADDAIVILSRDPEGNGYAPAAGVDGDNNVWNGEATQNAQLTDELRAQGFSEEDTGVGEPCVVLWPSR